jgi:hypothetical protein
MGAAMIRHRLCWLLLLATSSSFGHEPSRALVTLDVDGQELHGRWEIALRDLEDAVGLDADGDSAVTWTEVVARQDAIVAYASPRLRVSADAADCPLTATPRAVDVHGGGTFAVLTLAGRCAASPRRLEVAYALLFEIDRAHRAIVTVNGEAGTATAVASFDSPRVEVELGEASSWPTLRRFVVEGVRHIWEGYDHLAFVSLLLLPIALRRRTPGGREGLRAAGLEIVRVVTAFTAAHSLTLALAASGYVAIPTRLVEIGIAASVLVAAVLNVVPKAPQLGAKLAFGFGLLHGFGFANVLGDLTRGGDALLATLGGFNLGVELGQLVVVAALLPLLFVAGRSALARVAVNTAGSVACGALAIVWIGERWA